MQPVGASSSWAIYPRRVIIIVHLRWKWYATFAANIFIWWIWPPSPFSWSNSFLVFFLSIQAQRYWSCSYRSWHWRRKYYACLSAGRFRTRLVDHVLSCWERVAAFFFRLSICLLKRNSNLVPSQCLMLYQLSFKSSYIIVACFGSSSGFFYILF